MLEDNYSSWDYDKAYGVRPVVTLKPNVKAIGGEGTSDEPYQLVLE